MVWDFYTLGWTLPKKRFSTQPLGKYTGNPIYNIYVLAGFLYDLPEYAGNPINLYETLINYLKNKASTKEKVAVQLLIHRLAETEKTRELAKQLSGVENPENFWLVR